MKNIERLNSRLCLFKSTLLFKVKVIPIKLYGYTLNHFSLYKYLRTVPRLFGGRVGWGGGDKPWDFGS